MAEEEQRAQESEPFLKYHRVDGVISDISETGTSNDRDKVSCIFATSKYLLIGTVNGVVHQTTLRGKSLRTFDLHAGGVTDFSVDATERYFGSSSDDGCVCIVDLDQAPDRTLLARHKFRFAVKAVSLDPSFATKREKVFGSGGIAGKCILTRRGWFKTDHRELHKGEGIIHAMEWCGSLIAWANDTGVKIYNFDSDQRIAFIKRPSRSPASSICPCRLRWQNEKTLMIGWGDTIKVVVLQKYSDGMEKNRQESSAQISSTETPSIATNQTAQSRTSSDKKDHTNKLVAQVVVWFETDIYVCGVAPFGRDFIALLGYVPNYVNDDVDDSTTVSSTTTVAASLSLPCKECPELRIISCADGTEVSSDSLPILEFEKNQPFNYGLAWDAKLCNDERIPLLYISSPCDVVAARPLQLLDRIKLAIERNDFQHALSLAKLIETNVQNEKETNSMDVVDLAALFHDESGVKDASTDGTLAPYSVQNVSAMYVRQLLDDGEYDVASDQVRKHVGENVNLWQFWISEFHKLKQIGTLARWLPYKEHFLSRAVYDTVVTDLATQDPFLLLLTLLYWHTGATLQFDYTKLCENYECFVPWKEILSVTPDPFASTFSQLSSNHQNRNRSCLYSVEKLQSQIMERLNNSKQVSDVEQLVLMDTSVLLYQLMNEPHQAFAMCLKSATVIRSKNRIQPLNDESNTPLCESHEKNQSVSDLNHSQQQTTSEQKQSVIDNHVDPKRVRTKLVFGLIEKYRLASSAKILHGELLRQLLELDQDRTIDTLVSVFPTEMDDDGLDNDVNVLVAGLRYEDTDEQTTISDVLLVVDQIKQDKNLLLRYLDRVLATHKLVYNHAAFGHLHDIQIEMYAEAGMEESLSRILRWSNHFSLTRALSVCETHEPAPLHSNIVLILSRMGGRANLERALEVILDDLRDVPMALQFVKAEQGHHDKAAGSVVVDLTSTEGIVPTDGEAVTERNSEDESENTLLELLVQQCAKDAELVGQLLEHSGLFELDTGKLIRNIPNGLVIPSLCERLLKVLEDTSLQLELSQNCHNILLSDVAALLKRLQRNQRKAVRIDVRVCCGLCSRQLCSPHAIAQALHVSSESDVWAVVVFASGDVYHKSCLQDSLEMLPSTSDTSFMTQYDDDVEGSDADLDLDKVKRHCAHYADALAKGQVAQLGYSTSFARSVVPLKESEVNETTINDLIQCQQQDQERIDVKSNSAPSTVPHRSTLKLDAGKDDYPASTTIGQKLGTR